MGTVDGTEYGLWQRFNAKSLVWYPKKAFEAAGYEVPTTWDELQALQDQIVSDGDPNYSPRVWPDQREAMAALQELYALATVTKPSLDDASRLFGEGLRPEAYVERFHAWGPRLVILTMGKNGVMVSNDGYITHIPALPVHVVDATGAGDAFWAGYVVSLLDGHDPVFCAHVAQAVVAQKLQRVGPLPSSVDRQALYNQTKQTLRPTASV
ncbi:MAG: PfkB family carbohydrate kinase [Anaerolineae bacterium]|nr:PfkB family carbohydrate kinase [Anaerolineae bacterium]